jgi:hypothetical protein
VRYKNKMAAVAYVSEQCGYCTQFVRALEASTLASSVRVISIERVARIPSYVVAVPTLVVEDETGISVFETDDAFDAVEGATIRPQPGRDDPPRPPPARPPPATEPTGPMDFDGEAHFAGIDAADEPDTFGCRANNFETLVSAEQDAAVTERTLAAWESSLRAESQSTQERSSDSSDKRLESLMQQRQVAAAAPPARVG